MAQAGGLDPTQAGQAIEVVKSFISEKLKAQTLINLEIDPSLGQLAPKI